MQSAFRQGLNVVNVVDEPACRLIEGVTKSVNLINALKLLLRKRWGLCRDSQLPRLEIRCALVTVCLVDELRLWTSLFAYVDYRTSHSPHLFPQLLGAPLMKAGLSL